MRLNVVMMAFVLFVGWLTTVGQAEDRDISLRIEALGKSAEQARIEAARNIQQEKDKHVRELEGRLAEVRKWTSSQFELGERGEIDMPKIMTELMTRWQKGHERELYNLLEFADKNAGGIESGRAINSLLTRVGPAAQQNQQARRLDPGSALPLHASTASTQLSEETFNRLTIQDNVLGTRDSRRGNADPIDVNWPAVLRDERWATHRAAVEKARTAVLDEMTRTQGVTAETEKRLRDAVGALNVDFVEYRNHWRDDTKTDTPDTAAMEFRRVYEGNTHIRKLIASVYFVVQAKSFADLPEREKWRGGNIEEFLAFMVRNNLQVGEPSKDIDRSAYHTVFNLMVRYYLDQKAMANLQQRLEQELETEKSMSRDALNVALGNTISGETQAALQIEHMNFIRDLIKN